MPYRNTADQAQAQRRWRKENPGKSVAYSQKWSESHREAKRAVNRRAIGEVGSARRASYNQRRRLRRKAGLLRELEASRKHRASLMEFITRKTA